MKRQIGLLILRIFAVLCMIGVPSLILYSAYDVFMTYNEDGMTMLDGAAIFALGGAFVFFTIATWVLAIGLILCEPKQNEDKKD